MAKGVGTRQDNVHSTVNLIFNMVLNKLRDCKLQKGGNVSISDILQTVYTIWQGLVAGPVTNFIKYFPVCQQRKFLGKKKVFLNKLVS